MTQDEISKDSKLTFDNRKKELHQHKSQVAENYQPEEKNNDGEVVTPKTLMSTVSQSMDVVYTEDGIKLAYKNLSEERSYLEKRSADLKKQFESVGEMPEDLKDFQQKMKDLKKFDAAEKAKQEHENVQARMKEVNKDMSDIKDTIGTQLKL